MKTIFHSIKKFIKYHIIPILASLGLILIFIAVLLMMRQVKKEIETYTIQDAKLYQYFKEQKREYNSTLTISNEKEITELKIEGKSVELDSTPFYYQEEKKVIFPHQMSVVFPNSNSLQRKVSYFTILDGTDITTYLKNANLNYMLQNAFLYDGNDLYFFPEGVTITVMGTPYSLTPFSYVIVNYNGECIFYDYEMNQAQVIENVTEDVIATGDNYQLNLSIDATIYGEKSRLLLKKLEYLDNLK